MGTAWLISPIHTHDVDGRIHDEPINGVIPTEFHTLGDFFDAWRTLGGKAGNNPNARFSETQLLNTSVDATHEMRMYVNGEPNFQFDAYIPRDEDDIVLTRSEKSAPASVVLTRFETTQGTLDVELLRDAAPLSVENFLNYINDGDYVNSLLHRSLPGFITQFGGFDVDLAGGYDRVSTNPAVLNEPNISNTERTIAYAKLGGDPNSATSQWFVNLGDNSSNLDNQNGGFTVFGRVINDTYDVAVAQSLIPTHNASNLDPFVGSAFTDLPIVDFPVDQPPSQFRPRHPLIDGPDDIDQSDLVVVTGASVVPTAMITGLKFNDLNANGVRDAGEQGLAG